MENLLDKANKIVVKVGTAGIITDGGINYKSIENIVSGCKNLLEMGKYVTLVTSGAIACGRKKLGITEEGTTTEKQMYAAVGQPILMQHYINEFDKFNIKIGQFLVTCEDFDSRELLDSLKRTHNELLIGKEIPIFNENDTIYTEEIEKYDNDRLAALVTRDLGHDLLLILTVEDGLIGRDRNLVKIGCSFNKDDYLNLKGEEKEHRGGLGGKLEGARVVVQEAGKPCVISNIRYNLIDILSGNASRTVFYPL